MFWQNSGQAIILPRTFKELHVGDDLSDLFGKDFKEKAVQSLQKEENDYCRCSLSGSPGWHFNAQVNK